MTARPIRPERARQFAKRLARQHRHQSYRQMAAGYPRRADGSQVVKAGTLNRIVNEQGRWLPKDPEILIALGLKKVRKKRRSLPKWLTDTPEAREWFEGKRQAIREMSRKTRQSFKKARNG